VYDWPKSTYIAEPPFFQNFALENTGSSSGNIAGMRAMALFGDSITTDHISPAGSIKESAPGGQFLTQNGVLKADFNSYGSRRGNHEVMMRGTFANVRIKNLMLPAKADGTREEGGLTLEQPSGQKAYIYDAAQKYLAAGTPTIVFAGEEYGTGSSRDWAAKGTALLGIKAVVARSFERIHRSNLVGMGVLPLQFKGNDSWQSLGIVGDESFELSGLDKLAPQQNATLTITRKDGSKQNVELLSRIDTPIEVDYYQNGGILPYVLRDLLGASAAGAKPAASAVANATVSTASAGVAAGVAATATGYQAATNHANTAAAAATNSAAPASKGLPWWLWLVLLGLLGWLFKSCMMDGKGASEGKKADDKSASASSSTSAPASAAANPSTPTAAAGSTPAPSSSSTTSAATTAVAAVTAESKSPMAALYFDTDKTEVKGDEAKKLQAVIDYLKANALARANVSGYHDPSGNKAHNEELAKNRAKAVREALKAAGLSEDRIVLDKPAETTAGGDAAAARRVEVTVRNN
jgi:outer membrane protein OmpA-like peptidoglycan-associated protein